MSDDYDPTNINAASWEEQEDYGEADGSEQYGEAEGSEQQDIQHSSEHQEEAEYSVESNPNDLGENPSHDGGNTDDVGDDYDPASVDVVTSSVPQPSLEEKTAPQPAAAPVAKKPRTAGGFLVGDSDDEDEDGDDGDQQQQQPVVKQETGSGSSSSGGSAPAQASASATAAPQSHSPAVQTTTTLTVQDNAGATSNAPPVPQQAPLQPGATTTAVSTTPNPAAPAGVPAPVTQAPALDRVTIYEEQIRDDPRGAMNAWLELMKEKRARSDIDGARQVYERFLAIFPQAVSDHPHGTWNS